MLTTDFWNYKYDVWVALTVSFVLTGVKQFVDLQPKEVKIPIHTSIYLLPVFAMVWVLIHGLGSNTALIVVGLNSLMFVYMGKNDKESPYNIVAVSGFVLFVIILFWSKLQLRAVHAYVIPVGIAILVLVQLFRDRIHNETRNQIRFVTLLAMLGSAGYYALVDDSLPVAYILVFGILSLLSMGLGTFLRIRLYLFLGFGGLVVDLCAIVYKVLLRMERSGKMTLIGSLVLVGGLALVAGAIFYKANQQKVNDFIDHWRRKLGAWE